MVETERRSRPIELKALEAKWKIEDEYKPRMRAAQGEDILAPGRLDRLKALRSERDAKIKGVTDEADAARREHFRKQQEELKASFDAFRKAWEEAFSAFGSGGLKRKAKPPPPPPSWRRASRAGR
jgi:hypothetical protein